ncbi:LacI family DNA-binding transcriptional regulator [Timonella senegalensis]|uniref:LacI family DNA-binding transcriptional regulator n=1 Tax=Timonella senegalensis TaxID=1465825 RepID=UPI002FDFA985
MNSTLKDRYESMTIGHTTAAKGSARAPRQRGKGATISEIAQEAGVSIATVSKVLNGKSDISEATKAHVEEIITAHNYKRRTARNARANLIELVFHELDSAWAMEIIRAVEMRAAQNNTSIVLSELGGSIRAPRELVDSILERNPLGVILVMAEFDAAHMEQFASRSIPVVVVDTYGDQPSSVPTVGSNNWSGGFTAPKPLTDLGHTRIGMISGPADSMSSKARVDGYRSALEAAGIEIDKDLITYGDFYVDGGYTHGKALLSSENRPTAIFAGSDMQALGVLRGAKELGLSVPGDLSVVGYDNIPLSEWLPTPLTTINQFLPLMGETATDMLLALTRGESVRAKQINLSTELVVRASTTPPAGA